LIAAGLCFAFIIVEIVGGVIANSLAIMSDAAHLFSDLAGFIISLAAIMLARRPATAKLSFGFHRVEIIGAIVSILIIWLLTGILFVEAIDRVRNPVDVDGKIMVIVASVGIVVNLLLAYVLFQSGHSHSHGGLPSSHGHSHGHGHDHGDEKHDGGYQSGGDAESGRRKEEDNINIRSAFVHVLGDTVQTIGVLIAGIIIMVNPDYKIADPICTFLFSVLVLFTTITIMRDAMHVLMEGTPAGVNQQELSADLRKIKGVVAIHGLHSWSITIGRPAVAVHLVVRKDSEDSMMVVLRKAEGLLCDKYSIHHTTIQVEQEAGDDPTMHCGNCCDEPTSH